MRIFWLVALLLAITACGRPSSFDAAAEEAQIRQVIADMEASWNRGDFRGYMAGFRNPDVVFVSRGEFQRDWQGTLDHYVRDYGGTAERIALPAQQQPASRVPEDRGTRVLNSA